jgi:hypothetical protein
MAAGGNQTRKVTIEFGTDQSSLNRALADIQTLYNSLLGLSNAAGSGGGGGGSYVPRPSSGSAPAPPLPPGGGSPPAGSGGGFGGGGGRGTGLAPSPGFGNGGGGGGFGSGFYIAFVQSIQIAQAQTVQIIATNVSLAGGGLGGGTDPNTSGAGQADQGKPTAISQLISRYAGPAALGYLATNLVSAGFAQLRANQEYQLTVGQGEITTAAGRGPGVGYAASLGIAESARSTAFTQAAARGIGWIPGIGAATSYAADSLDYSRKREQQMADEGELGAARRARYGLGLNRRQMQGMVSQYSTEYSQAEAVGDADGMARAASMSYASDQTNTAAGGFNSILSDPNFKKVLNKYGTNQSNVDQALVPIVKALFSSDTRAFPGSIGARRSGDMGQLSSYAKATAMSAAASGDYQGVMAIAPLLGESELSSMLDMAQKGAYGGQEARLGGYGVQAAGIAGSAALSSRQLSLYSGDSVANHTRGAYITSIQGKKKAAQQIVSGLEAQLSIAIQSGDKEKIASLQNQIAEQKSAIQFGYDVEITEAKRADVSNLYEEQSSGVGMQSASAGQAVAQAQLFGNPQSLYGARQQSISAQGAQIQAERDYLNALIKAGATLTEQNNQRAKITNMETQYGVAVETSVREKLGGELSMIQMQGSVFGATGAQQSIRGGTLSGIGSSISALGSTRDAISKQQEKVDRLPVGSMQRQAEETTLAQMKLGETQQTMGLESFSASPGLQRTLLKAEVGYQMATRTFFGEANVKASLTSALDAVGQERVELKQQHRKSLAAADPKDREAMQLLYEQQDAALTLKQVDLRQQLDVGFEDKLISAMSNTPGTFGLVSSSYNRRIASTEYGVKKRTFGGNAEDSANYRSMGAKLYGSYIGDSNRDEGITDSAMSQANSIRVEVGGTFTLKDQNGSVVDTIRTQSNTANAAENVSFKPSGTG